MNRGNPSSMGRRSVKRLDAAEHYTRLAMSHEMDWGIWQDLNGALGLIIKAKRALEARWGEPSPTTTNGNDHHEDYELESFTFSLEDA